MNEVVDPEDPRQRVAAAILSFISALGSEPSDLSRHGPALAEFYSATRLLLSSTLDAQQTNILQMLFPEDPWASYMPDLTPPVQPREPNSRTASDSQWDRYLRSLERHSDAIIAYQRDHDEAPRKAKELAADTLVAYLSALASWLDPQADVREAVRSDPGPEEI